MFCLKSSLNHDRDSPSNFKKRRHNGILCKKNYSTKEKNQQENQNNYIHLSRLLKLLDFFDIVIHRKKNPTRYPFYKIYENSETCTIFREFGSWWSECVDRRSQTAEFLNKVNICIQINKQIQVSGIRSISFYKYYYKKKACHGRNFENFTPTNLHSCIFDKVLINPYVTNYFLCNLVQSFK